jgi:hypothetical protein
MNLKETQLIRLEWFERHTDCVFDFDLSTDENKPREKCGQHIEHYIPQ